MARPKPEILDRIQTRDGVDWYILKAATTYVITYRGEPINLKSVGATVSQHIKYKKMAYANRGNCLAQVRRLNDIFMTEDFAYITLGTTDEITNR
jgi:hypothetical protein